MANDYNLGAARGVIQIDYDSQGVPRAVQDLAALDRQAQNTSAQIQKAGKGIAAAGGAITAGFILAIKTASDFEKQLSAIKAVSQATPAEMDKVRTKALQLGKDTKFSAGEAGQAIEELVKAGISVADVMNGAADATVSLAAAGEISLPEAATIASNAMNQFQLEARQLPHIADVLAGAANASAIGVSDLGQSLEYVGPVANAVGTSIEDTATAIAILGNQGIKGSSAGTALRSILTNLVPVTKRATTEFKNLGLITEDGTNLFVDQAGAIKPLSEVVDILNDKTKDLSKTQKNTFAKKSFGLESLSAVSILASQTADSFDEMSDSINKTTAADVAAARMDNLQGSIEQLKGSFETVLIVVGTPFLHFVNKVVDGVNLMVGAFLDLPGPIQDFIGLAGALAGVFLLIVGSAIIASNAIKDFRIALLALSNSALFTAIRSRLIGLYLLVGGPWLAAFAAAAAAVAFLFFQHKKGKPVIEGLTEAIKADNGALEENSRKSIAAGLAKQGLLQVAKDLGVNLFDLTKAVTGDAEAQDRVNASLAAAKAPLQAQLELLGQQIVATGDHTGELGRQQLALLRTNENIDKLTGGLKDNISAAKGDVAAVALQSEAVGETATVTEAAQRQQDLYNEAIGKAKSLARESVGATTAAATGVKKLGDSAEAADISVTDLNKALKQMIDDAFGAGRAADDFQLKLNGLKQQAKDNGTSLKGNSDAVISNRNAFRDAAESASNYAQELLAAGEVAPDEVAAKVDNLRAQLIRQGDAAGFSRKEISRVIAVLEDFPTTIDPTYIDIDTAAANRKLWKLQTDIDNVKGKTVKINVVGGIGALEHNAVNVPALAKGGLIKRPTLAVVGEGRHDEIVAPIPAVLDSMLKVFQAGQVDTTSRSALTASQTKTVGQQAQSSSSRIVNGTLKMDPSGHAFITGLAQDVYDGEDQFATSYGRMG